MYNYISGKIVSVDENLVVVDAGGIGYEILCSARAVGELGKEGIVHKIYTYLNVREDEMSLYGFSDKREKSFFLKLISISGIGPKVAITILGSAKLDDLIKAIALGDLGTLSKIKGIGKKTAERLVLELKDKLSVDITDFGITTDSMSHIGSVNEDAVLALMSLGYSKQDATIAVSKVEMVGMTVEQIIMRALKGC